MPDETCRCEVLDPTTEGGGTDERSCPVHAYEAGRRDERARITMLIMANDPIDPESRAYLHELINRE